VILADAINKAIADNNPTTAGRIIDLLRFKHGLNYESCYAMFRRNAPDPEAYDLAAHDALMVESDDEEGQS